MPAPLWKKGQSGNPAGRPRASKSPSFGRFRDDFMQAYEELGGLDRMIAWVNSDPTRNYGEFLKLYRSLFPKEIKIDNPGMSFIADELIKLIQEQRMKTVEVITVEGKETKPCMEMKLPPPTESQSKTTSQH